MAEPVDRIADLLSRLGPIQGDPRSTWAKAGCPAHDDQEPSLTFHLADDGWVLLRCHAGCDRAMILSALGLSLADIGPPRDRPDAMPAKRIEHPYRKLRLTLDDDGNYQATEGATILTVYRPGPNGSKCGRSPAGVPTSKVPLYRIAEVAQAVLGQHPAIGGPCAVVAVVEGEKDADALWRHDPPIPATCNAGGASKSDQRPKWTAAHAAELAAVLDLQPDVPGAPVEVYVIADNDDAGFAHARAVYESLHTKGIPVEAFLPSHHRGIAHYDIADQLGEGHPASDLEPLNTSRQDMGSDDTDDEVTESPTEAADPF